MKPRLFILPLFLAGSLILTGCQLLVKKEPLPLGTGKGITTTEKKEQPDLAQQLTKELCIEKSIEEIKKLPEIAELIALYEKTLQGENEQGLLDYRLEVSAEDQEHFFITLSEQYEDHTVNTAHLAVGKADGNICMEDVVAAECLPQKTDPLYLATFADQCASLVQ